MAKVKCQFINDKKQGERCQVEAQFHAFTEYNDLTAKADPYSNDVYACGEHLGDLLGYDSGTKRPELVTWRIFQL